MKWFITVSCFQTSKVLSNHIPGVSTLIDMVVWSKSCCSLVFFLEPAMTSPHSATWDSTYVLLLVGSFCGRCEITYDHGPASLVLNCDLYLKNLSMVCCAGFTNLASRSIFLWTPGYSTACVPVHVQYDTQLSAQLSEEEGQIPEFHRQCHHFLESWSHLYMLSASLRQTLK